MDKNIKKNFVYNVLYQILILILPFITVPYVSRILGADGIGIYSYTYSIVNYFMLIAMLGINNYGNRTIAKVRENKKELSRNFVGIYSIQLIMSFIMIILYLLYIIFANIMYKVIAMIQIIYLVSNMLDINWFFFGLEKFKLTVSRSTFIKITSLILIFLFVKTKNDLWIYTLILSGSTFISQIILFYFLKKEISFASITKKDIKSHIKPILTLFIPVVAISLYKVMDKIMLGNMSVINEVGYYEQAEKIIGIPLGIITALGTVMLPRISNLIAKNKEKEVKIYIKKSINFMMFMAFPLCFGLIAISHDFIPIFLGKSFIKSSYLVNCLSITILFLSFANVIRTEYLIPKEKDNVYIASVILGAISNLIINYLLIPRYASIGAAIGTIFAEFFVMFYQIIAVKNELPIKEYVNDSIKYLIKSLVMFCVIMGISQMTFKPLYIVMLQIIIGVIIYAILNTKYIFSIIDFKKITLNIKRRKVK